MTKNYGYWKRFQRVTLTSFLFVLTFAECVKVDLSIALDSSGSVRNDGWRKSKEFSKNVLSRMRVSSQCARVSLISIGTDAYVYSRLDTDVTDAAIKQRVDAMKFRDEWTNTGDAFKQMTSTIYRANAGDRSDAVNVAILVTDGPSNRNAHETIPNADVSVTTRHSLISHNNATIFYLTVCSIFNLANCSSVTV